MQKMPILKASVFLSFFVLLFTVGCSSSQNNLSGNTVTGQIQMVNNEPFAELALRNNNGLFILDCSGAVKDTIYYNQGKTAKIYFSSVATNKMNQKVLKVEKVELVPAESK